MYIDPNEQRLQATNEVCLATIEFQTALLAFTQLHGAIINKDNYSLAISRTSSTFGKGVNPKMAILSFYENLSKSLQELQKQYLEGVKFNVKWDVNEEKESFTRTSADGDLTFVVKKHGEWGWMLCVNNHPIVYLSDQEKAMSFAMMIDLSEPKQEVVKKSLYDKVVESMKESESPEKIDNEAKHPHGYETLLAEYYWIPYTENAVKVLYKFYSQPFPNQKDYSSTVCVYQDAGFYFSVNLSEPHSIKSFHNNLDKCVDTMKEVIPNGSFLAVDGYTSFFILESTDGKYAIAKHPIKEDFYYIFRKDHENTVKANMFTKIFDAVFVGRLQELKEKLFMEDQEQ